LIFAAEEAVAAGCGVGGETPGSREKSLPGNLGAFQFNSWPQKNSRSTKKVSGLARVNRSFLEIFVVFCGYRFF
ncbi:MAG TPA: hypothetical protein PLS03_02525, partial [Terrimicrobiaceae bacterium]|nr:hypothetical protein [Terrimicrobiaceae bacterium]